MLIRYGELKALRIDAEDGAEHAVRDVLIADGDLSLVYVVADFSGWFTDRSVIVRREDFAMPDLDAGTWPVRLREHDLEHLPRPAERASPARGPQPGAESAMPLGPGVEEHRAGVPEHADPGHAAEAGRPRAVGDWIGTGVGASDRPAGRLVDAVFDTGDWCVTLLVVEGADMGRRAVPVGAVASFDWAAPGILLDVPAARVASSPALDESEPLAPDWHREVAGHYGRWY